MASKMKKLIKINRDGTIMFKSKQALNSYIRDYLKDNRDRIIEEDKNQIYHSAYNLATLLSLEVLHIDFGFGDKRLSKFLERYKFNLESLSEGYYEYDELLNEYKHLLNFSRYEE